MRAILRQCASLASLLLVACRPPLSATPCSASRPCPPGYTCDLARGYCAPSVHVDGSAADGLRLDVVTGDRAPQDLAPADRASVEMSALDVPRADALVADQGVRDLGDGDRTPRDVDTSRDRPGSSEAGPADRPWQADAAVAADACTWPDSGMVPSDSGLFVEASVEQDAAGPGDANAGSDVRTPIPDGGGGGGREAGIADLASVQPDHAVYLDRGLTDLNLLMDGSLDLCLGSCPSDYTCTMLNAFTFRCCIQSMDNTLLCVTEAGDECFIHSPRACWLNGTIGNCCDLNAGCKVVGDSAVCTPS